MLELVAAFGDLKCFVLCNALGGFTVFKQQIEPLRKWVSSRSETREIHPFLGLIKV